MSEEQQARTKTRIPLRTRACCKVKVVGRSHPRNLQRLHRTTLGRFTTSVVPGRRAGVSMARKLLHGEHIDSSIQQNRHESPSHVMGREGLDPGLLLTAPEDVSDRLAPETSDVDLTLLCDRHEHRTVNTPPLLDPSCQQTTAGLGEVDGALFPTLPVPYDQ